MGRDNPLYMYTRKIKVSKLEKMPTLAVGQADDLKLEDVTRYGVPVRVWLSRMTEADGVTKRATVEHFFRHQGKWKITQEY